VGDGKSKHDVMRQKAAALHAVDARIFLESSLPHVLRKMTPAQIQQVQRIFDAAVVNPGIEEEANALYRRSAIGRVGNQVYRDPDTERRAYKVLGTMISVTEADKRIRLKYDALLEPDVFKPVTDNPDEAAYLKKVKATLEAKGVWLRIGQPWVRRPDDPSSRMISPQVFEAWLSLGPEGDAIPTKGGRIDREALLKTTVLGAGYYSEVDRGKVQKGLDRQITRLSLDIDEGIKEHNRLRARNRRAAPGVAEISDLVGGADLPDRDIWDFPEALVMKARQKKSGGNVLESQAYLVMAAVATRNAAQALATYAEKSEAGAAGVVTVLKIVKTVSEVAEVGLAITGVGGVALAGRRVAMSEVDQLAIKVAERHAARNPEIVADINKVRTILQPKGSVAGRVKAGTSSGTGSGWHKWP